MLQFYAGHAECELVMGVGKAGEVVNLPGEVIPVVEVGRSGDDDGGRWSGGSGGCVCLICCGSGTLSPTGIGQDGKDKKINNS